MEKLHFHLSSHRQGVIDLAKEYDLVIIGGGTGGYVAAIRASQLGLKTAIVEKEKLGGTCLHAGCIPSKALLKSAEVYQMAKNSANYGIETTNVSLNFKKIQERKNQIIQQLYNGVQYLVKKREIDVFYGIGRILGPSIFSPLPGGSVSVEMNDGKENEILIPKNILLATGSRPRRLTGIEVNGKEIVTSDEALEMDELPKSMIIIGGGVIGIEWASMLADFDVEVTVIEYEKEILPSEDFEIRKEMTRLLKKKGIKIFTNTKVLTETIRCGKKEVSLEVENESGKKKLTGEKLLISIGRQANIEGIGLENTDIEVNNGYIRVNEYYQTKEPHIYAIGDCIGGLQLAHVASKEGIIAVEHMAGIKPEILKNEYVPKCIYSHPEVASIGYTEEEAKKKGHSLKIGKFPFKAIGKALIGGRENGFIKIIADEKTDDLLGIHMIGPNVTDLISEASLAKILDATPWELSMAIHPHPTLSEIFAEAGLAVYGKEIHL